jgi:hypothetical protein
VILILWFIFTNTIKGNLPSAGAQYACDLYSGTGVRPVFIAKYQAERSELVLWYVFPYETLLSSVSLAFEHKL